MKSEAVRAPVSISSEDCFSIGFTMMSANHIKYIRTRSSITIAIEASLLERDQLYLPTEMVWLVQLACTRYYQFAAVV